MKWTDIEIRRHVIPNMSSDEEQANDADDNDLDDDLPPILEKVEDPKAAAVVQQVTEAMRPRSPEESEPTAATSVGAPTTASIITDLEEVD
jgi:hypothetical protein